MASVWNRGIFVSIYGESHSKAIGVVVDNFPAGIKIDFDEVRKDLQRRSPLKKRAGSTQRMEDDEFEILSGIYDGYTSGAPISAVIYNKSFNSSDYFKIKDLLRPSHADYTAKVRYDGFNDPRGAGHCSGRLTATIVFVGSICKMALRMKKIRSFAHIFSLFDVKDVSFDEIDIDFSEFEKAKEKELTFLDDYKIKKAAKLLNAAKKEGDSIGAVVECGVFGVPAGIGSPMFDGIENYVSNAVFAIPAVKGVEFGKGFSFSNFKGSEVNDEFYIEKGKIKTKTNNNGGILGGISTGMPIVFRVVFKPTPTIFKKQQTVNINSKQNDEIVCTGFHDCCVAVRGVFVVEAAANLAILSQLIYQGRF